MRRTGRVGPDVSHRWSVRNLRAGPIGPDQMRADAMRRPAGDSLRSGRRGVGLPVEEDGLAQRNKAFANLLLESCGRKIHEISQDMWAKNT
jgi:hypothetical protein